jgi:hypothetical protein
VKPLGMEGWKEPTPEQIEPLLYLSREGIARLVLWLLVEEALRGQLSAFRPQHLSPQPVEGAGELLLGGPDVVPVGDVPR